MINQPATSLNKQNQMESCDHKSVRYIGRYTRQRTYTQFARCNIKIWAWV